MNSKSTKNNDSILATENLRKYFGEVHAVDDVSLNIRKGELASVIGPNGSGKSTLINLISGLVEPDSGKVFFKGTNVTKADPDRLSRMGLMRSFQVVNIFDGLSVLDNVRIPISCKLGRTHNLLKNLEDDKELRGAAEDLLKLFGLLDKTNVLAQQLPHGDRKLLDVAICFAMQPDLVLLDEPTSGVSTSEKWKIMEQIINAVKMRNMTAVIVEHDMDIVFSNSDRVIVMNRGKVLADGTPTEIKENEEVRIAVTGDLR